jgi:hypothetical protein
VSDELPRGVYLAPFSVERPQKASQTLLNKISDCPYSGALYLRHKDTGVQSHEMARGEAIHSAIEVCTNMAIEEGEIPPPEVCKAEMQAILNERVDLAMSPIEHEACRVAIWNWAVGVRFDPGFVACVETMLELEIGGWLVRGKLDLAEIRDGEGYVHDYKTGLHYPDQEEHENDFQQQFYGLLLLEGVPEGEDIPLGKGLAGVHLNAHFPRITDNETPPKYFRRHAYKDRGQMFDFKKTVEAALAKLDHGLQTGEWKAVSNERWCKRCPARHECPLPEAEVPDVIETSEEARTVGDKIIVVEQDLKALKKRAKTWVENEQPIPSGGEHEYRLEAQVVEKAKDKEQIKAALRNAGLDPDDFYRVDRSMRFGRNKVEAA